MKLPFRRKSNLDFFRYLKLSYLLDPKNTDLGWILGVKLGSEIGHVGSKTARCPVKRNFSGTENTSKIKAKNKSRPPDLDGSSLPAQGPLGGL